LRHLYDEARDRDVTVEGGALAHLAVSKRATPSHSPHVIRHVGMGHPAMRLGGAGEMKIHNRHQRLVRATSDQVAALVADFDAIWPTQIAPAPREAGHGLYDAGLMVWEEYERPGAARAFRLISPEGLRGEHWFELERVDGGTLLRHTVEGEASGGHEAMWIERIEPLHNRVLEAILDNVEAAVAADDRQ
jgi:hypothetical protein